MYEESEGPGPNRDVWMVERAIVLQILRDDHEERWPREELAEEISDFESAVLDESLRRLERDGVLQREGDAVWAARATRRLDELELISI
jgi:DNA-binding HxlR family transcriptional regulator